MRRARLHKSLEAVATGKVDEASVNLEEPGVDVPGVIEELTRGFATDTVPAVRLVAALRLSGAADGLIERMDAKSVNARVSAARTAGALRMYDAVPYLGPLLGSRDRSVADASARALGKIGGANSAGALLRAIQRRGVNRRLVAELARSAPDQFIESALAAPAKPGVKPALALAAGLRRRRTATTHLMGLVQHGGRRERVIGCRALGWIGATTAIPLITEALGDRDWKVRIASARALGALRAHDALLDLRYLEIDRNPRVRKAARQAIRQIEGR
jgi:HEAT repeat protein